MSDLDLLVQHAMFAADRAAMASRSGPATASEVTEAAVRAALELLLGNGLVEVVPRERWPEYVVLDPPYRMPW